MCQELGFGKLLSVKSGTNYSSSYDAYDLKNNKRIQVKCSTSTGPSSFGPKSVWDDIYFLDMWNNGNINGNSNGQNFVIFDFLIFSNFFEAFLVHDCIRSKKYLILSLF